MLLWWSAGVALLYWSQAISVDGLYTTQADFDRAAASMESNAGFIAMTGPARALNTIGGQVTWQSAAFGAIAAGLMSMFLVGRHTRAEEESGRDEMLRAAAVGRQSTDDGDVPDRARSPTSLLGALVALSLIAYPLEVADSLALGVGRGPLRVFFSGVALVAAQLTSTTRATYGLTGAVLGLAYALRAIGDVGHPGAELDVARSAGTRRCTRSPGCAGGRRSCWWPAGGRRRGGVRRVPAPRLRLRGARRPARAGPAPAGGPARGRVSRGGSSAAP